MFNGTDLVSLSSGGESKKFTLKVFLTLFTVEEMADGIVEPSRANSSGKATLDQERVDLLKSKYSENLCKSCILVYVSFFCFCLYIL